MTCLRRILCWIAACLSMLGALSAHAGDVPPPPKPNLSSPEEALRSYWAIHDWSAEIQRRHLKRKNSPGAQAVPEAFANVTTGGTQEYWNSFEYEPPPNVQRTILKVSPEGSTRVSILTNSKNVSPIPEGAIPKSSEVKLREEGQDFKYVIERTEDGWRVSEVWSIGIPGIPSFAHRLYEHRTPRYPCCVLAD